MSRKPTFENALQQLEQVVECLERGDLPLEQALTRFEDGVRHAAVCRKALTAVELKVERLLLDARGDLTTSPLAPPRDEEACDDAG